MSFDAIASSRCSTICDDDRAAVGQACAVNDVPYLVVRAISDRADGSSDVDFQAFLREAAYSSSQIVLHLLEAMAVSSLDASAGE